MADYFFIEHSLKDTLTSIPDEKLVPLQSIIDSDEVKEKVRKAYGIDSKAIEERENPEKIKQEKEAAAVKDDASNEKSKKN